MKSRMKTVALATEGKQQMVNLTQVVDEAVAGSGIRDGLVGIYCQHTTAAVFISEFQAALIDDVTEFLGRMVDDGLFYKHNSPAFSDCDRRNAASHLRSVLLSHSVLLPVANGKPVLGQFQSVILAELDGPRQRTVEVQILGE